MKTLNRMTALLSTATVLLCLAGGCGNNSGRDRMTDDTTTLDDTTAFGREPDVAEPIDTNTADVIRERTPDIPEDGNRQNTGRDSSRPAPQAP